MKKCICFLKNNYHYIVLLITLIATMFVTFSAELFGDDFFYMKPAISSSNVILQFLKWHLMKCNGRTIAHFFVLLFLRNNFMINLWRILSAIALTLLCWLIPKLLFTEQNIFKLGVCVTSFTLMTVRPNMFNQSVYWLTGSFNYLFPILFLIIIMIISLKKPRSKWLLPLSFFGGATVEQIGMMCVGWFVLLFLNNLINKKTFSRNNFACILLSALGFLTIVFSPGTSARITNQSSLNNQSFWDITLTMARKNWLDNISLYVMICLLSLAFCIWAFHFREKNRFTGFIGKFLMPIFAVLFVLNTVLRIYVTFCEMILQRDIDFSAKTNRILLLLWTVYFILFVFLSLYSAILIYIEKKNFIPAFSLILAYGSQFMMILTKTVIFRTCFPAIIFFAIYLTYSYAVFLNKVFTAKQFKMIHKISKALVCLACIIACAFQLYSGVYGECLFHEEPEIVKPYNQVEMEQMLLKTEKSIKEYYSSENSDLKIKYDYTDFSLYK